MKQHQKLMEDYCSAHLKVLFATSQISRPFCNSMLWYISGSKVWGTYWGNHLKSPTRIHSDFLKHLLVPWSKTWLHSNYECTCQNKNSCSICLYSFTLHRLVRHHQRDHQKSNRFRNLSATDVVKFPAEHHINLPRTPSNKYVNIYTNISIYILTYKYIY